MSATTPAGDLGDVLAVLGAHARALADGPRRPTRVRLEARGVALEMGWGDAPRDGATSPPDPGDTPSRWTPTPGADPAGNGSPGPEVAARVAATAAAAEPRPGRAADQAVARAAAPAGHRITSPMVGTFYRASEPGASPFVSEGDLVAVDQELGLVEAMKLMVPIRADRAGRVTEILCADATAVEFGTPLLVIAGAPG